MRKKSGHSPFALHPLPSSSGQAATEMIFLLPLFVILAAGAVFITYMCWQGIKVQEAANAAARMAGQETVGGARDDATRLQDNGLMTGLNVQTQGDADPESTCGGIADPAAKKDCYFHLSPTSIGTGTGVYWKYRDMVRSLFSPGEQLKLFVPPPIVNDYVSQVTVSRAMQPPKVFGWQMAPVTVKSTAYGGEDSFMYGLPRFGRSNTQDPAGKNTFWQQELTKLGNDATVKNDHTGE